MLQILRRFGWTWVGLLFIDSEANSQVAQSFQSELTQSGVGCLAYMEALPYDLRRSDPAEHQRVVTVMKKSTARVVISFLPGYHTFKLMEEVGVMIHFSFGIMGIHD